jgi:hypothetical protein
MRRRAAAGIGDGETQSHAPGAPMLFEHGPSRKCWVARGGAACGVLGIMVVHGLEKQARWRVRSSYMSRFSVLSCSYIRETV